MQRKMLELIDSRFAHSAPKEYEDHRNFRALMIYAMSGGNPATVDKVVSRLILEDKDARLSAGLLEYVRGESGRAVAALREIDPHAAPADIAPSLALVKGTLFSSIDPKMSLEFLDFARLAGPGTLVEEAALRRSLALAVETGDGGRFLRLSEQYVRRFLRSPYASQFADSFVAGIARLYDTIDLDRIAAIIGGMNAEQSKVIYLRIARQAAIDRLDALAAFADKGLETSVAGDDDPRAALYSALALVASEKVGLMRKRLDAIDPSYLSESDRTLLDAAKAIVEEVTAQPPAAPVPTADAGIDDIAEPAEPLPGQSNIRGVALAAAEAQEKARAQMADYISERRSKLQAIDELLKEEKP
jgi:chemotaxis protein MotC